MSIEEIVGEVVDQRMEPWVDRVKELVAGDKGLSRSETMAKLGLSEYEWKKLNKQGLIPKPHNPFTGKWSSHMLDEYIAGNWKPRTQR